MSPAVIVLRYFSVIGRAQALRHALAASGRFFEDFRLPLPEWSMRPSTRMVGDPYPRICAGAFGSPMRCSDHMGATPATLKAVSKLLRASATFGQASS